MKFCSECGYKIIDNSKFCSQCGCKLIFEPNSDSQVAHQLNQQVNQQPIQQPTQQPYTQVIYQQPKKSSGCGTAIVISLIVVFVLFIMLVGIGTYIDEARSRNVDFEELIEDEKELAIHCAKTSICHENHVDEDDVNWKKVKYIGTDGKGKSLVYIDCKLTDNRDNYKHLTGYCFLYKIKPDLEDQDIEWKFAWIDEDENYTMDEQIERIKTKYDWED